MAKVHIDDGNGNALCGLRVRGGEERGYTGKDSSRWGDSITEGAVHKVEVKGAFSLMSACGSRNKCSKCCKKWKKLNNIED